MNIRPQETAQVVESYNSLASLKYLNYLCKYSRKIQIYTSRNTLQILLISDMKIKIKSTKF